MPSILESERTAPNPAEHHDCLWRLASDHHEWLADLLIKHLALAPHHRLVDLGAGTGLMLQLLCHRIRFYNKPIAVEPDRGMLALAKQRFGVRCLESTAEDYLVSERALDRVLMKEMVHHLQDRPAFWRHLLAAMNPGGRAVVMTRPQVPGFPFFDKAMEAFVRSQPAIDRLLDEISQAGLVPEVHFVSRPISLSKERWETMLRNRFSSNLNALSDADIEQGIRETRRRFVGPTVDFDEQLVIIEASHPEKLAVRSLFKE
jgi:cyclopropane fatty-acyl-phospholipid synthase-like methyltransferase